MSPFEQNINAASRINQDTVYQVVGDLYCNYHGIIMWLNCIVDVLLYEDDFGGAG